MTSNSEDRDRRTANITIQLDQQQYRLVEFLRREGTFGQEDGAIVRGVILDYLSQMELEESRRKPDG